MRRKRNNETHGRDHHFTTISLFPCKSFTKPRHWGLCFDKQQIHDLLSIRKLQSLHILTTSNWPWISRNQDYFLRSICQQRNLLLFILCLYQPQNFSVITLIETQRTRKKNSKKTTPSDHLLFVDENKKKKLIKNSKFKQLITREIGCFFANDPHWTRISSVSCFWSVSCSKHCVFGINRHFFK